MKHFVKKTASVFIIFCLLATTFSFMFPAQAKNAYRNSVYAKAGIAGDKEVKAVVVFEGDTVAQTEKAQGKLTEARLSSLKAEINRTQSRLISMIKDKGKVDINATYSVLLNGIAVTTDYKTLSKIENIPGVKGVYIDNEYKLDKAEINEGEFTNVLFSRQYTGVQQAEDNYGVTGDNVLVAVFDTGINYGHEAFQDYGHITQPVLTEEDSEDLIQQIGRGSYVSAKIPFMYDYFNQDDDAMDYIRHGTHVASIIGGLTVDSVGDTAFKGVAPAAQLAVFKIFDDEESSTYDSVYLAAFEDAYTIGVDIINCSWGSPAGFSAPGMLISHLLGDVYETLHNSGIICIFSAGNEGNLLDGSEKLYYEDGYGDNIFNAQYMDIGYVGEPASYPGNIGVASANNLMNVTIAIGVGASNYEYTDISPEGFNFIENFGGEYLDYVMIPGYGRPSDYNGLDVSGKIAVVSRGEISFEDKQIIAYGRGAEGIIVYNNDDGLLNMSIEKYYIPAIFVSKECGQALAGSDPKVLYIHNGPVAIQISTNVIPSDFSSWGTTSMLTFNPVLTGIGGYVYGADGNTDDGYITMSGTSMAAPNVTGCFALMLEYLKAENPDMEKADRAERAENLLISTSIPLNTYKYDNAAFLPRRQGAGLANPYFAIQAAKLGLYLPEPIFELGDDPEKEGDYTFTFTVENNGSTTQEFSIYGTMLFTDFYDYTPELILYFTDNIFDLVKYKFIDFTTNSENNEFTVGPGETAEITVNFFLDSHVKNLLNILPQGTFLEGYVYIQPSGDAPFQHVSFIGYYGDWGKAPCIEDFDFRDETDIIARLYYDYGFTYEEIMYYGYQILYSYMTGIDPAVPIGPSVCYTFSGSEMELFDYLGVNPYVIEYHDDARNAISNPNSDTDYVSDGILALPALVRNASHVIMVVSDTATGEIYYIDDTPMVAKNVYDADDEAYSFNSYFMWMGTDGDGQLLPNNTTVQVDFFAWLDWEDGEVENAIPDNLENPYEFMITDEYFYNEYCEWSFPVTIDCEGPTVYYLYDDDTKELTVECSDNQYLMYGALYNSDGTEINPYLSDYVDEDECYHYYYDLSGLEDDAWVHFITIDYATNFTEIIIDINDGNSSNYPVEVTWNDDQPFSIVPGNSANYMGNFYFRVIPDDGYGFSDNFTIEVDGDYDRFYYVQQADMYVVEGIYSVYLDIEVYGFSDIGEPYITFTYDGDKSLDIDSKSGFGFNHVVTEPTEIVIDAFDDEGTVTAVMYCISSDYLSQEELEGLDPSEWAVYETPLEIDEYGSYVINVYVTDEAGNEAYISSDGMILDNQGPDIRINGLGSDISKTISNMNALITVSVSDGFSDVGDVSYTVNGGSPVEGSVEFIIPVSDLPEGTSEIVITANDTLGNSSELKFSVTIDTTPPAVTGVEEDGIYTGKVTATIETGDLLAVFLNGKAVSPDENGNLEILSAQGEQTLKVVDVYGNFDEITFTVNPWYVVKEEAGEPVLDIRNDYIMLGEGMTVEELLAMFENTGFTISGDRDGKVVTGTTLTIGDITLTLVIDGDVNGDGICSVLDYISVRLSLLDIIELEEAQIRAANDTGNLGVLDYIKIRLRLLGINQ